MRARDKILGTLYGQAIGDAMGMPSELWPVSKIRAAFNGRITTFMASPADNDIGINFERGQYTDDTNQALAILDSLIETNWQPEPTNLVDHILAWADQVDAWHHNILGPSSKAALLAIKAGQDPRPVTQKALTNGAAMRIAPIGTLFEPSQQDQLIDLVCAVTQITHASDVAYSGAAMVAGAVTAAMADYSWDEIVTYALQCNDLAFGRGAPTWGARTHDRLLLGIELAHHYQGDEAQFSRSLYNLVGTGTMISESVPAAVAIAYFAQNVHQSALLAANLGGDTDTIGAMATAICGAKTGFRAIDSQWCQLIDQQNPQHDLSNYADKLLTNTTKI